MKIAGLWALAIGAVLAGCGDPQLGEAQERVRIGLRDPASAEFRNVALCGLSDVVEGEVNSANALGGKTDDRNRRHDRIGRCALRRSAPRALRLTLALLLAAAFTCTPVRVWDGDGPIWCAEGPRVRLAGIAAREIDGSCRRGQPCPKASGVAARDALVRLVGVPIGRSREGHFLVRGPTLACRVAGRPSYRRVVAWCASPRFGDLSCALVKAGVALRWARYDGAAVCRVRRFANR